MKKVLHKTHTITFQECSGGKILQRAFDTPKETVGTNGVGALHLDFHLKNLQKMPDVIKGVKVVTKQR